MNEKKLTIGISLLVAGLLVEIILPFVVFKLFSLLTMGGVFGMFVSRLIALVAVVIIFIKGGGHILQSANKGKLRTDRAKTVMLGGLLIYAIPKVLMLFTIVSYETASIIGGFIVPLTSYFIPHILAIGMVVFSFFILSKEQSVEEIEEEERMASQPVPISKFTYIGSAIVALPFLIASILLFEELYSFPNDYLLPANPISSNLFWLITIIMFINVLSTEGLQFYKLEYRDSRGNKVSYSEAGERVLQDQIGAIAMTFLMPAFQAAIMALIPYYILYFTIGFFLMNGFTIALLILLMLAVFGGLFVFTRKNKNKTAEILWLVSWFFIGIFLLFILSLFL